jgi:hypothetical protein
MGLPFTVAAASAAYKAGVNDSTESAAIAKNVCLISIKILKLK